MANTSTASQNFAAKPASVTLVNMVTTDSIEVQFNPEQLEEQLGANYAKLTVPGLSHQRSHFVHTEENAYSFDLFNHALGSGKEMGPDFLKGIREDRRFLMALVHPWRAEGIDRGGAPKVLFIWPQLVSLPCKVLKLGFKYTLFNKQGAPVAWTCKVSLEVHRDSFVSMEDVLNDGTGNEID